MPIDTSLDFVPINIAIITISDSRTKENDTSGDTLEKRISDAGHTMIKRTIIPDDVSQIKDTLNAMSKEEEIDCIITTGGTGLTGRDTHQKLLMKLLVNILMDLGNYFDKLVLKKLVHQLFNRVQSQL